MYLAAFRPRVTRIVDFVVAVGIEPFDRPRDQGQNHDSWVSMPTVLAAGAICAVLNRDGRWTVGREPCVEVIVARAYFCYAVRRKR